MSIKRTIILLAVLFLMGILTIGGSVATIAETNSKGASSQRAAVSSLIDDENDVIPVTIVPESALRYIGD